MDVLMAAGIPVDIVPGVTAALGAVIDIPKGLYPGDYLKPVGAALAAEFGESLRNPHGRLTWAV